MNQRFSVVSKGEAFSTEMVTEICDEIIKSKANIGNICKIVTNYASNAFGGSWSSVLYHNPPASKKKRDVQQTYGMQLMLKDSVLNGMLHLINTVATINHTSRSTNAGHKVIIRDSKNQTSSLHKNNSGSEPVKKVQRRELFSSVSKKDHNEESKQNDPHDEHDSSSLEYDDDDDEIILDKTRKLVKKNPKDEEESKNEDDRGFQSRYQATREKIQKWLEESRKFSDMCEISEKKIEKEKKVTTTYPIEIKIKSLDQIYVLKNLFPEQQEEEKSHLSSIKKNNADYYYIEVQINGDVGVLTWGSFKIWMAESSFKSVTQKGRNMDVVMACFTDIAQNVLASRLRIRGIELDKESILLWTINGVDLKNCTIMTEISALRSDKEN